MTKPNLKTLSLSLLALVASASASASEQTPLLHLRAFSSGSPRVAHASPSEIERGWVRQQQKLDALIAARSAEGVAVPGAIILPPFPNFAPYRTDLPQALEARKQAKPVDRAGEIAAIGHD